ncbi:MAG: SH3 domain-containing protein [Treponemataceae bacterium]|nr:SH3 domain-containing protein [Treponemataceae bacterium]
MFTNVIVDDSFCNEYENLIRMNKCDLSKVNWPRHADGSCDYDDKIEPPLIRFSENNKAGNATANASENPDTSAESAIPKPSPDLGKTATVTENLRLRADDKTTSQVVTTLAARTRVKVLAPGRDDTIDGITSKWVQVSVLGGAKDKDGNTIEAGTKGWLFGGYLSETKSAESESPNAEVDVKESSALPIVPIAAGGAALAVLLAAILLAAKKKKYEKK